MPEETMQEETVEPRVSVSHQADEPELGEGDATIQEDTQADVEMTSEDPDHATRPADFDKEELCVEGGEIDKALETLYKLCEKHDIPCLAYVNYKVHDGPEKYDVAIRGMNVACDGWMPPIFTAMMSITSNQEILKLVERLTDDPMALLLLKMLDRKK